MDKRPMLATPSTGSGNRAPIDIATLVGTHVFDLKMDGVRAFAEWNGSTLVLTNRNGVDVTWKFPELVEAAPHFFDLPIWLDGEIVCDSGRFEDTLTRDKQSTAAAAKVMADRKPASFHAFDMPVHHQLCWPERRYMLEHEMIEARERAVGHLGRFQVTPYSTDLDWVAKTRELGLEGVIAKSRTSKYEFGARSKSWIKFKNLHRVTCLVSGYEPGTGSRAHFGKMNLAMIDPSGTVVPCGSVGTGFTMREIDELKKLLDAGQILVVEIECLNRTSGGTLRFPVYKGIRTDVDAHSCTIDQLDTLPAC